MNSVQQIIKSHNRICWYPSAGADFRELLFLSEQYCAWKDVPIAANELPDLFILTDCNPGDTEYCLTTGDTYINEINGPNYYRMRNLFSCYKRRTMMTVKDKVKLVEKLDIEFNDKLYRFDISPNYGNAFYFTVHIVSKQLGEWDADVLYILAENTSFAFDYLIKNNVTIDYIIKVRYGDAFGESTVQGDWLLKLIKPLNTKYYLRNKFSPERARDAIDELKNKYPESNMVADDISGLELNAIHKVDEIRWSWQGDIYWYRVNTA